MYHIRSLLPEEYAAFRPMLFEQYRKYLTAESTTPIFALGAWVHEQPRGLLLFELPAKEGHVPLLRSIFVNPAFRKLGIGLALMQEGERLLRAQGHTRAFGEYGQWYKGTAATEALLAKAGWKFAPYRLLAYATGEKTLADPLLTRIAQLRPPYTLFLWEELLPEEREALKLKFAQKEIPPQYDPFTPEHDDFFRPASLGLRYEGQPIGWMILTPHHLPNHLHFSTMYVVPEHAAKGVGMGIMYEAAKRACLFFNDFQRVGIWQTFYDNPPMIHTIEKRLAKHCHAISRYNRATKNFSQSPTEIYEENVVE